MTETELEELAALIAEMRAFFAGREVRPERCCGAGCSLCPVAGPLGQLEAVYAAELAERDSVEM